MEFVIGKKTNAQAADDLIAAFQDLESHDGILYIGYPILATSDEHVELDALFTSSEHGLIIFDFLSPIVDDNKSFWETRQDYQNQLYIAVKSQLMKNAKLCKNRELAIPMEVFSFLPTSNTIPAQEGFIFVDRNSLNKQLNKHGRAIEGDYNKALNAALQRVSTIKPSKKRNIKSKDSRGGILKQIENEIANLDQWQKGASIESPEGPQRIRGLAGSGKTIVLALKAAYLHAANPDWTIVVTFYTRSLYNQFKDLIRRFSFEHSNDEPDWSKIKVMHCWGTLREFGVYSEIANYYNTNPVDFGYAKDKFGRDVAFEGICTELLKEIEKELRPPLYDAILIDEAQDLPDSFFKLVYKVTREPKRTIWAYDELQNLSAYSMQPPNELFGDEVYLKNISGQPRQDIVLPICYRNTPWALVVAHALGFGIYRDDGLVQFFEDSHLLEDIGYEVVTGTLQLGKDVTIRRRKDSVPNFFYNLVSDPLDAVVFKCFKSESLEAEYVAESIRENIQKDELECSDILVIFPNPINVKKRAFQLTEALQKRKINYHITGITTSRDIFFMENSVTISGIYRAKGNEAPMVYVMNADYCYGGFGLIRKRNSLFTAITRSRAWVRVTGCGQQMVDLMKEYEEVVKQNYHLKFKLPTKEELAKMRRIHRDMTPEERKVAENMENLVKSLERGDLSLEDIPDNIRKRLINLLHSRPEEV